MKPATPHRSTLSPSSFYSIRCPRCLWLEYWHGIKLPANLALQLLLSRLQEAAYDGVTSKVISTEIPAGKVAKYKKRFTSQAVKVNGEETRWKIYGEIDLLVDHNDGTYSIVDGKVSMKKDAESLIDNYWTQLEAHRYIPIPRQPEKFQEFLAKFIGIIEGEFPESGEECDTCGFLEKIGYQY
ncbi:MAG: hypothetical protein EBW79_06960 [Actinobacteria bacterium]|nr:hypothetical protein [Actinomycetota bacterium]